MQTYFILGDSRSGTSLVGRILHTNGIVMGTDFKKPTSNNPYGYFEDLKLREMNGLKEKEELELFAKEYVSLRNTDTWGMKNPPKLPFHVEYFLPHLEEVKYIVTKRKIEDQKRSIQRAINPLSDEQVENRINKTYKKIKEIVEGQEYIEIQFDDWFTDKAQEQMKKLADFCGFDYSEDLLEKYVDPKLHRFK